jgi:Ca2+-transporting ATPase
VERRENHMLEFLLSPSDLNQLIESKNIKNLDSLGGIHGIAQKLFTSFEHGLSSIPPDGVAVELSISSMNQPLMIHPFSKQRQEIYGENLLPKPRSKTFWQFMWDALHDKMLAVLLFASIFKIGIGIYKAISKQSFDSIIDGGAIIFTSNFHRN